MGLSVEPTTSLALIPHRQAAIKRLATETEPKELSPIETNVTVAPGSGDGNGNGRVGSYCNTTLLQLARNYNLPQKIVLDNGLTIIADPMPNALSCYLQVWVNAGSMHEKPDENVLHILLNICSLKGQDQRLYMTLKKR